MPQRRQFTLLLRTPNTGPMSGHWFNAATRSQASTRKVSTTRNGLPDRRTQAERCWHGLNVHQTNSRLHRGQLNRHSFKRLSVPILGRQRRRVCNMEMWGSIRMGVPRDVPGSVQEYGNGERATDACTTN